MNALSEVSTVSRSTPPIPGPVIITSSPSPPSSTASSDSEGDIPRRNRYDRPRLGSRQPSASIIIPKGKETLQRSIEYPPDDARAMSPRRNSADLEKLGKEARLSLREHAKALQSSLAVLAERIDEVKSGHDKLESENKFLQDYIGGLTRTMSKGEIGSSSKAKK